MTENGPVVLVVDDVAAIVEELVALLALQGIPALGAHNLQQAVEALEQEPGIRVVACDVRLDRESGLEIVERVDAHPHLRDRGLHYVFITGNPVPLDPLPAAPHSVLTKPVSPQALVGLFHELLMEREF